VRLWELTPEQYTRTAQALLPIKSRPGDDLDQGQNREASGALSEGHVNALWEAAKQVAAEVTGPMADPAKVHPCLAAGLADAGCQKAALADLTERAFRREVKAPELETFTTFFTKQAAAHDPRTALRLTLRAILSSPHFVFRFELGPEGSKPGQLVKLTPAERATALAYFLTDGPPDAALTMAARTGGLETRDQVAAQTKRLLGAAESASGFVRFFRQHFRLGEVVAVQKSTDVFKAWTPQAGADLEREAQLFVQSVLWQDGGKLETLLTASHSFANSRLASLSACRRAPRCRPPRSTG
jgi:hypothetical protein